jgi:stress response protein SCP2
METKIEKEVRYLKIYAVVSTIIFAAFMLSAFVVAGNKKFAEIDVERINVVEKDGKLKMVISNKERQHPGAMDSKIFDERKGQRPAGMIFFNEKGDEIGGLVFDGDTGKGQSSSLTFDKFRGDQTIQLLHAEEPDGKYFAGLRLNDQNTPISDLIAKQKEIEKLPTKEAKDAAYQEMQEKGMFYASRLDIGRDYNRSAFIKLKDAKGRSRIEMSVAANGNARLNFLDENGKVVYSLPDQVKK